MKLTYCNCKNRNNTLLNRENNGFPYKHNFRVLLTALVVLFQAVSSAATVRLPPKVVVS
jgi:hypothetical protein